MLTKRPRQQETSPTLAAGVRLQRRNDLRFQRIAGERWNLLDPVTRQSYRVGGVEHWLLTRPDGRLSTEQLLKLLRDEHPQLKIGDLQLLRRLDAFIGSGLLWSDQSSGGGPIEPASYAKRSKSWQAWLGSTVSWQIRGINPDRWLQRWLAYTGPWLSPTAVRVWLLLALLTGLAVLLEFKRLAAQSLSLEWILHPTTAGSLFAVFVVTRGLHELGHAMMCKRFGVRCPDIGLFIILGAPCVYCDVSESWQLPQRWQRAAVAAAGMYVELIVATLAAWVWLATVDGPLSTLALQTMLVCSLSTIVINANPLMRFDGYYILADLLDEVSLRSKADGVAAETLQRLCLGVAGPRSTESNTRRHFLLAFSLAGWIYRAGLSLMIAGVLVSIYGGWNLLWVGRFLAAAILISWWGVPAVKMSLNLWQTARQHGRRWRLAIVTTALIGLIAWLPLPSRQLAKGWLQPTHSRGVYVGTDARLVSATVRDGALVRSGQTLFELHSEQLEARLVRYRQTNHVAEIRLQANTRRRDMHAQEVDLQYDAHQLDQARNWVLGAEREIAGLTLVAPIDGRLIAMAAPPAVQTTVTSASGGGQVVGGHSLGVRETDGSLPSTWCEPNQAGRWIASGSLLASICSATTQAVVPLSEEQLASVASGTPVHLRLSHPQRVLRDCRVQSVVQIDELSSPWQQAAMAALREAGPLSSSRSAVRFAAVIEVPEDISSLPGATVDAVFVAQSTTLFRWGQRWLQGNLRWLAD